MQYIDGFRTTDSFRFDRNTSSSTISLSSSSGYGSRLSLSQTDHSSSNRRLGLTKYFKEKISRHKSLASLLLSPKSNEINNQNQIDIYDNVWNLDEQIDKIRSKIQSDCQSIISMSVDEPEQIKYQIRMNNDQELLSAAAWYQPGLSRYICEEYLIDNNKPIGSFIIRHSYTYPEYPFVISIKTKLSLVEHFLIEQTIDNDGYRLQGSSKTFDYLSTLVLHHTIIPDILPVTLILPFISSPFDNINRQQSSSAAAAVAIRSVRF